MENTANLNDTNPINDAQDAHTDARANATHVPLTRASDGVFGGVFTGIARHQRLDVPLVRLIGLVVLLTTGGSAFVLYLAAWVIIPKANELRTYPATTAPTPVDAVAA